ncbi:hypothetical protein [Paraflavitalea speifideaquila]|uniref:hypothetical protein n=1 Tax=Paraflavitalea speifideaquila TaxID=3076558 RepID=UPI0028E91958|nr:hypothetical protein [Paraflavitalea speifideiaquila]
MALERCRNTTPSKITYPQDKDLSLQAVWNIDNNTWFQLSKEEAPFANFSDNRKYAVISTNKNTSPPLKKTMPIITWSIPGLESRNCYLKNAGWLLYFTTAFS